MPETVAFRVDQLRGQDNRWHPNPTGATRAVDLYWDQRDGWGSAGGFRELLEGRAGEDGSFTNPWTGQGEIVSLHWFSQHNGARQWLLYENDSGSLYAFNASNIRSGGAPGTPWELLVDRDGNNVTGRTVPTTPWQRTQSQTWKGRIYLVNGLDRPLVFDGTRCDRAGYDQTPPAPDAASLPQMHATTWGGTRLATVGVGPADDLNDYACAYRYRVSFVNARGEESPPSEPSATVSFTNTTGGAVSDGCNFVWVDLPIGGSHVIARRIYRTQNINDSSGLPVLGRADTFYYHSDIEDNTTVGFEDGLRDSDLGSLLDPFDFGLWPEGVKYLATFKDTMFIAGMAPNEVRYSAAGHPETFPVDNVFHIGDADLGPVTGLFATRNALVVMKPRALYLIKGDPVNGFFASALTRDVGCAAPRTMAEVPNVGLCFLADDGVYCLEGTLENEGVQTKVTCISAPIPSVIAKINRSALLNACGTVYHRDREYWIAVPTLGAAAPNLVIVFHYDVGAWTTRSNLPINCILETHDHRGYLIFGSHQQVTHPGLHVYSRGWADKDGTAIAPVYETANLDLASLYRSAHPVHALFYCVGYGNNDLQLNYTVNRDVVSVRPAVEGRDQQYPHNPFAVFDGGTVLWGTATWGRQRPVVVRFDLSAQSKGPVHELSLTLTPAGRHMQIIGYDIEVAVGESRNIRPLNPSLTSGSRP